MLKLSISKYDLIDKHDEYINYYDRDDFDKKDGSHEIFSDVIEVKRDLG